MNRAYNAKAIQKVKIKTLDGSEIMSIENTTLGDGITKVDTLPAFSLNLCDSMFYNPPQKFIYFIVSYLQNLVGKDVYVVTYLPLRSGMEDVDVYQGTVKNHYAISRMDSGLIVTISVYIKAWNMDANYSPIAIFKTKQEAEKFADYLRNLKGSTLEVVASEVTTVVKLGCDVKRYLMVSPEHDDNFVLD